MFEFEGVSLLRRELTGFRDFFCDVCSFSYTQYDVEFISFLGKRILFFKILSSRNFARHEATNAFSELLACSKYIALQDYRGLLLNERSFLESCLQIINLPERGLTTAKMFEHASLDSVNSARLKQLYHGTSELVHHDRTEISTTLQVLFSPSPELNEEKRKTTESDLMWLIETLVDIILGQYTDDISSAFFVRKPELEFVIGKKRYKTFLSKLEGN